jgi:hypothetical protein
MTKKRKQQLLQGEFNHQQHPSLLHLQQQRQSEVLPESDDTSAVDEQPSVSAVQLPTPGVAPGVNPGVAEPPVLGGSVSQGKRGKVGRPKKICTPNQSVKAQSQHQPQNEQQKKEKRKYTKPLQKRPVAEGQSPQPSPQLLIPPPAHLASSSQELPQSLDKSKEAPHPRSSFFLHVSSSYFTFAPQHCIVTATFSQRTFQVKRDTHCNTFVSSASMFFPQFKSTALLLPQSSPGLVP